MKHYKECARCHTIKQLKEFNKNSKHSDGLASYCRECNAEFCKEYNKTKRRKRKTERAVRAYRRHYDIEFIVGEMFYKHIERSKKHAYKEVTYTRAQLIEFVLSHQEAYLIHDEWVKSGHIKSLRLSVDRIDATKGYNLDNIQIMTWGENNLKGRTENRNKKPTKGLCRHAC